MTATFAIGVYLAVLVPAAILFGARLRQVRRAHYPRLEPKVWSALAAAQEAMRTATATANNPDVTLSEADAAGILAREALAHLRGLRVAQIVGDPELITTRCDETLAWFEQLPQAPS